MEFILKKVSQKYLDTLAHQGSWIKNLYNVTPLLFNNEWNAIK